jgi:hypothetical protein
MTVDADAFVAVLAFFFICLTIAAVFANLIKTNSLPSWLLDSDLTLATILRDRIRPKNKFDAHSFDLDNAAVCDKFGGGVSGKVCLRFYKDVQYLLVGDLGNFTAYALHVIGDNPLTAKFTCSTSTHELFVTANTDEILAGQIHWCVAGNNRSDNDTFVVNEVKSTPNKTMCNLRGTF